MEKKLPRVLISDKLSLSSIDIFKKQNIDTDYKPGISNIDLLGIIDQYDGLAIRSTTQVTQEIFEKATTTNRGRFDINNHDFHLIPRIDMGKNLSIFKIFLKLETLYEDINFKKNELYL